MASAPEEFVGPLIRGLDQWEIAHTDGQVAQLWAHCDAVVEANRRFNLTRITDPAEAAVKHVLDSLALLPWMRGATNRIATVLDVGTGAGFPAVPIAIMAPGLRVTAIDATRKKCDFVGSCVGRLHIEGVDVHHARAERWRPDRRFDVVACRAVSSLANLLIWTAHLVGAGGFIVAYKGGRMAEEESAEARRAASGLGLRIARPFAYTLDLNGERIERRLFVHERVG